MITFYSFYNFIKCFVFFVLVEQIMGDYYSSKVGLEKLISMEENLITAVESYFSDVEEIHSEIESFLDEIELEHKTFNQSDANYYDKPMNAFKIIKRFVVDWKNYDDTIGLAFKDFKNTVSKLESNYIKPNASDLLGAARGLTTRGNISDNKYSEVLTADDTFALGKSLYYSGEFLLASEWFLQALQQMDNKQTTGEDTVKEFPFISHLDIFEFLRDSLFDGGYFKLAKIINRQLEHYDPKNTTGILANKELYESAETKERRLRRIQVQKKIDFNHLTHGIKQTIC